MVYEIFVHAVMFSANPHDNMIREGKRTHTYLFSGMLLAEEMKDDCTF